MRSRRTALAAMALATPAFAGPDIVVQNHSFEIPPLSPNGFTAVAPPGWLHSGGGTVGVFYPTEAAWGYTASDGNQLGYMNSAFIEQTLDETLQPGIPYTLLVDVIARPGFFSGYTVEFYAGDTVIASDTDSLNPPPGDFEVLSLTYTADDDDPLIGEPLKIRLGGPVQANFDRVRVITSCEADCNDDGNLNILDFVCYQGLFTTGDPAADCNGDGNLNILDFVCFQGAFTEGCG